MQNYVFEGRTVQAVQWLGQPLPGVTIEEQSWGKVGVVETVRGTEWMTIGDWLIYNNEQRRVVTPAMFALKARDAFRN